MRGTLRRLDGVPGKIFTPWCWAAVLQSRKYPDFQLITRPPQLVSSLLLNGEEDSPMSEETPARPDPTLTFRLVPVLLLALVVAAVGYSFHERSVAKKLAADNGTITANLNATRDQLNTLSAKVNAMETKPAPEPATKPAAAIYHKPLTAAVLRRRIRSVEDPRWKK